MKTKLTADQIRNAEQRIALAITSGRASQVWSIVANNANTVSRKHANTLCPDAPKHNAPMKAWREWVVAKWPNIVDLEADAKERRNAERVERAEKSKRETLFRLATHEGECRYGNIICANSLEYVKARKENGFYPVKKSIGTYYFSHEDGRESSASRNKSINAAIAIVFCDALNSSLTEKKD